MCKTAKPYLLPVTVIDFTKMRTFFVRTAANYHSNKSLYRTASLSLCVDHLSRLSRVPGEITGQHKDSNLLFCIVTCYCDNIIIIDNSSGGGGGGRIAAIVAVSITAVVIAHVIS